MDLNGDTGGIPSAEHNSLGALLNDQHAYRVPEYQRDYSWEKAQLEDFWRDLHATWRNRRGHYLGQMLFENVAEDSRLVIDGQQRFTTVLLLLIAAEKAARRQSNDMATLNGQAPQVTYAKNYIIPSKAANPKNKVKLTLNVNNKHFMDSLIMNLEPPPLISMTPFQDKLKAAMEFMNKKISHLNGLDELADFMEHIMKSVSVTCVVTDSGVASYNIYECLNNRGLRLSESDLIKNHLFRVADAVDRSTLHAVKVYWENLKVLECEKIDEYFRSVLMLEEGHVMAEDLYSLVTEKVHDPESAEKTMAVFVQHMDVYMAIHDANKKYWHRRPQLYKRVRQSLNDLKFLSGNCHQTILMAGLLRYTNVDFERLVKLVETFVVRNNVICDRDVSEQGMNLSMIGNRIFKEGLHVDKVKNLMMVMGPGDKEFQDAFRYKSFDYRHRRRTIGYLLMKIEASSDREKAFNDVTIEHVLPQSRTPEWMRCFDEDAAERCTNRLGNFALLEEMENITLGNSSFQTKRQVYLHSNYKITRMIGKYDNWDSESLDKHQQELSIMAVKIWKL